MAWVGGREGEGRLGRHGSGSGSHAVPTPGIALHSLQMPFMTALPLLPPFAHLQPALAVLASFVCWTSSAAACCAWRGHGMRRRGRPLSTWQAWWPNSGGVLAGRLNVWLPGWRLDAAAGILPGCQLDAASEQAACGARTGAGTAPLLMVLTAPAWPPPACHAVAPAAAAGGSGWAWCRRGTSLCSVTPPCCTLCASWRPRQRQRRAGSRRRAQARRRQLQHRARTAPDNS